MVFFNPSQSLVLLKKGRLHGFCDASSLWNDNFRSCFFERSLILVDPERVLRTFSVISGQFSKVLVLLNVYSCRCK